MRYNRSSATHFIKPCNYKKLTTYLLHFRLSCFKIFNKIKGNLEEKNFQLRKTDEIGRFQEDKIN